MEHDPLFSSLIRVPKLLVFVLLFEGNDGWLHILAVDLHLLKNNDYNILYFFLQDYEYASYNPVAFDIANHFCEMAANYHTETPHILDFGAYPGDCLFPVLNCWNITPW